MIRKPLKTSMRSDGGKARTLFVTSCNALPRPRDYWGRRLCILITRSTSRERKVRRVEPGFQRAGEGGSAGYGIRIGADGSTRLQFSNLTWNPGCVSTSKFSMALSPNQVGFLGLQVACLGILSKWSLVWFSMTCWGFTGCHSFPHTQNVWKAAEQRHQNATTMYTVQPQISGSTTCCVTVCLALCHCKVANTLQQGKAPKVNKVLTVPESLFATLQDGIVSLNAKFPKYGRPT